MAMVRLAAIDLDGTLLDRAKSISPENRRVIVALVKRGEHIVLASGRMNEATSRYARQLGMANDTPVISYNGALVRTLGGETWLHRPVAPEPAAWLVDFCHEQGYHLNYYLNDTLYVEHDGEWAKLYRGRTGSVPNPVTNLAKFRGDRPTKLILIDTRERTDALVAPMKERFGTSLYITKTDDEYLEFMNPEADKGQALAAVAARLGVRRADCISLGDNHNDIPMLQWAGTGIAMENARDDVRSIADVIAPDCEEDGVAVMLERFFGPVGREDCRPAVLSG